MTIHQIINDASARGGAEKIVRTLHQSFLERGLDSRIVSLSGNTSGIPASQSFLLSTVRDFRAIFKIRLYIKEQCSESDIVHVHLFPSNLFVSLAKRISGWNGHLVYTEHSTHNRRRGTWRGKLIDSVTYYSYSKIACISKGTQDALKLWMPKLSDRLSIVENGILLSFSEFFHRKNNLKAIIVSVGSLQEQKNYTVALQAVALLKESCFEYWIAGDGKDEVNLRKLTHDLGIEDKVKFLGYVENIPKLLQQADIFLMPSKWEGFGLSVVEAMNAGLPVIVSNVDGLREVVSIESAFLVSNDQPCLFADAIHKLISNPELRIKMGKKAFERAKRFSAEAMVDKYIEFYSSVMRNIK